MKICLVIFTNDINIVIKKTIKLCDRQISKYIIVLSKIKVRFSTRLDKILFVELKFLITFFACELIIKQYKLLLKTCNKNENLLACTKRFRKTIDVSCAHEIETRLINFVNKEVLKLVDIHFHWRFEKSKRYFILLAKFIDIDSMKRKKLESTYNKRLDIRAS